MGSMERFWSNARVPGGSSFARPAPAMSFTICSHPSRVLGGAQRKLQGMALSALRKQEFLIFGTGRGHCDFGLGGVADLRLPRL